MRSNNQGFSAKDCGKAVHQEDTMRIAVAQLITHEDKQVNLKKAITYIEQAKARGADIVVLPETYMAYIPGTAKVRYAEIAEPLDGLFVSALAEAARKNSIFVVCGVYETKPGDDVRCYNTIVMLDRTGKLIHSYQKTHLYDAFSYTESKNIVPSDNPIQVVQTELGCIGLLVCYELRFPEISRMLALQGADIIFVPTAWVAGPMKEEHILSMVKARALENTLYMAVADQVGNIYAGRSVIYNPMGVVLASRGEDEGLIFGDADLSVIQSVREKLPAINQRRPEMYKL